ncbi:MAG: hypothetical protein LBK60_00150, partial [Verrucomicrobiales bacterium]|nr:hypothetical protein [Verrucomicrobiales bacterium]
VLAFWRSGVLAFWRSGVLAFWRSGVLAFWRSGVLAFWRSNNSAQSAFSLFFKHVFTRRLMVRLARFGMQSIQPEYKS